MIKVTYLPIFVYSREVPIYIISNEVLNSEKSLSRRENFDFSVLDDVIKELLAVLYSLEVLRIS
jgi:hypothetical protein